MSAPFLTVTVILVILQFALPKRLAFAPLLIAICTLPDLVVADVGVSFTLSKTLILAGLIRAFSTGGTRWTRQNRLDAFVAAWAIWGVLVGFAHDPKDHNPITVRLSTAYDFLGTYLYVRTFVPTPEHVTKFVKILGACMAVLAAMMAYEKATTLNVPWSAMTGSPANALSREGRVRANGPFRHPILAGTVAASSLILLASLRKKGSWQSWKGVGASALIVFFSASSGPIFTLMAGLGALMLWRWRTNIRGIRTAAICSIVLLHFVMSAPVWYLIARMDLAGGSTGWHRAELITKAIEHFDRWWLVGTDYTRDWMAYGIQWSDDMVDITNLYIQMGVRGGLLLLVLFVGILVTCFRFLGRRIGATRAAGDPREFMLWCFGAALFAHSVTFLTVTYYDQSSVYFYMLVGVIPGLCYVPKLPRTTVAGSNVEDVSTTLKRAEMARKKSLEAAGSVNATRVPTTSFIS